jgi:tetratricopeptide (TPR) repeat protein
MANRTASFGFSLLMTLGLLSACPSFSDDAEIRQERRAGDDAFVRGDNADAERHYKRALELAKKFGSENENFVESAGDLAKIYAYSVEGRDAEAEALYRERLSVAERIWAHELGLLGFVYDDLAMFYLLRDRYDEAHPLYMKALALKAQAFGANSRQVAQGLDLYSALLKVRQHEQEGLEMEARARAIREKGIH